MGCYLCPDPQYEVISVTAKQEPAKFDVKQSTEDFAWNFGQLGSSMLKTLNPILITIIVMSAMGVLLGAVCVALLYCTLSHNLEETTSALEKYNFELVDNLKLKGKVNRHKSYTDV
ncbi:neuropilin-1a-like [Silurus meridionalis]|nr:neuropilin-1a-like [Silurus meridionalis]